MVARHWLYFAGFVLSGIGVVGAGLLGVLDALSVLAGGVATGEELVVLRMLGAAAEWLVVAVVFGLLAVVLLAGTVVSVLRNTSLYRSDRLVTVVERLEREYPILREFDAAERVEPTTEDRKQELRERYLDGEISDEEFERELDRLLNEEDDSTRNRSYEFET
ncbi:hypothetical protein SAMN05216226_11565 [Halovenus aranensis]|uniref:Short C-terminal domain-containing protein n=1 Tax=Halovenus aranensis TaxID=890420 RepID=A0A1G8YNB6_9EURY|nr:SHOCT domain-containing protein [Halovenus aranensis]SDK04268.1 hypothetical protein SAMN05216226_11565 [Halovenus aranensis]